MRKIKLMALLLAALMIMSAFAGCANGVQKDVTGLNDRVTAIEDKLNGLDDKLDNLDNKDILDAIESMGKDLNDKIEDLNGRVDAVETPEEGTATPDAVKAAVEKAVITIEVKSAEFAKNIDEYAEEDYVKILEALGAAKAAVNTAATEADVAAALATLDATLKNYMTYAMRMYDYYTKLLGNFVDDEDEAMAALVEEIETYIEDVILEVYEEDGDEKISALDYKVDDKQKLDVYNSVKALCAIFNGEDASFEYVNGKGRVAVMNAKALEDYIADAKALVKRIDKAIGDEIIYSAAGYGTLDACIDDYKTYVAAATIIGGDDLVALVTNSDKLAEAETAIKNLADAAENFDDYAGYDAQTREYLSIEDIIPTSVTLVYADGEDYSFTSELYAEAADLIADWADEYDISAANIKAIFTAKGVDYNAFVARQRLVEYKMVAYETFKSDVAPAIAALNKGAKENVDSALKYAEVEDMIEELVVVLVADKENDKVDEAILSGAAEIVIEKEDLVAMAYMAGIYTGTEEEVEDKLDALSNSIIDVKEPIDYSIALYTFNDKVEEDLVDFFTVDFKAINEEADKINDEIKSLARAVKNNNIASVKKFVLLSGEYATVSMLKDNEDFIAGNGDKLTNATEGAADMYILLSSVDEDIINGALGSGVDDVMTIAAFNAANKGFEALIDTETFKTAWDSLAENVAARFEGAKAIVEEVAKINYAKDGAANTVFYNDANGNGKYDNGVDTVVATPTYKIGLAAADSVLNAKKAYDAWVLEGGRADLEMLVEAANADKKSYENVYSFAKLNSEASDIQAAINTVYDLNAQITELQGLADVFTKTVANVVAADKYSAYVVSKKADGTFTSVFEAPYSDITNGDVIMYYAVTAFKASTDSKKSIYDGTYTYAAGASTSTAGVDIEDTQTSSGKDLAAELAGGNVTTKKDLLDKAVAAYNAYKAAHLELVADAANDYTEGDVYYRVKGVAANDAVKSALSTYEKYDLLYAKGTIINKFLNSTNDVEKSLQDQAVQATSFAQFKNVIDHYNSSVEAAARVKTSEFTLIYNLVLSTFEA